MLLPKSILPIWLDLPEYIGTTLLMHKCFCLNQFWQCNLIFLSTLALDFQIKCQSLGASSELSWEMSRESKRLIRPGSCLWGHPVAKSCAIENNVYAVSLFTNCWLCTHILLESKNTQQKCLSKETYCTVSSYVSSMCMWFLFLIGEVQVVPPSFSPFSSVCCLMNMTRMFLELSPHTVLLFIWILQECVRFSSTIVYFLASS